MQKLVLILFAVVLCASAQESRGTLAGLITDPSGARVTGAAVVATNVSTGVPYRGQTNASGAYTIPFLPPGEYSLKVTAKGFKSLKRSPILIQVQSKVDVDASLELGSVSDVVNVRGDAPILDTATASTGQVIENRRIVELPLNGRNPLALAQISPGVVSVEGPTFLRAFDINGASSISIGGSVSATGGAVTRSNDFTLDGAPNTTRGNTVAYVPPADAVEEFKVETATYDASSGHTSGGTINISTRSGTNDLHGSLYYFHRDAGTTANTWFNNRASRPKTVSPFHQWGAAGGGPVLLPRLYNGRNRTFWFTAYEGIKSSTPAPFLGTVPTERQRQGDFSELLTAGIRIYDPYSTRPNPSSPGRFMRDPLPNNVVPANRIDPVAKSLLQFFPLPNLATTDPQGRNNYFNPDSPATDRFASWISRFDHSLNDRHRISSRFSWNHRTETTGDTFSNISTGSTSERINKGAVLDDTLTINPTTVFNGRFSWTRFEEPAIQGKSVGYDVSSLGFSPAFISQIAVPHIPGISFTGYSGFGGRAARITNTDLPSAAASVNKVLGAHIMKTGIDFRVYRETGVDLARPSGGFTFGTDWTRGPADNAAGALIGQDLAELLYGLPSSGTVEFNASRAAQAVYTGVFLHDDWKIRRNLTLNLGLRYEYEAPLTERFNRAVRGFDTTSPNPVSTASFPVRGGLSFASKDNRGIWNPERTTWAPRIGFAWSMTPRTTIRGGYGIFYQPFITDSILQPGFSESTPMVVSTDFGQSYQATLTNPFPGGLRIPAGAANGIATFNGLAVEFIDTGRLHARAQRWSFGIQRQIPGQIVMDLTYTGNHSSNMDVDRNINFVPRERLSTSPTRDQATIDFLTQAVPNPLAGRLPGTTLNGNTIARQQLLLPFPQFTTVAQRRQPVGSADFHAATLKSEKRFSHGVTFLASYTLSKTIEERSFLNDSDQQLERRLAAEDRPHRFVMSGVWELPLGLSPKSRFGGWQIQGISMAQSGQLLNWGNVLYYGGPIAVDKPSVDRWFDTSVFENAVARQLQSNIRTFPSRVNSVRQSRINNFDMSLLKNTRITERVRFQARVEFFNAMNHPTFGGANTTPGNTNFGRVTSQSNLPRQIQFGGRILF
ncbi:MAG: carboxypeptidase regulatory-like domain-containing protein [Bryobacteraceae bacterium]|nr:carboxypeptidase regulatory-like domain-containing protein [Bryobacteraceae bacterium]